MQYVDVLYALCDSQGSYSKVAGTSICSMLENTTVPVRIHIFHDGSIQGENRSNFEKLVSKYKQKLLFYNVKDILPEVWREAEIIFPKALQDQRFTEAALYRLVAPQVLPDDLERIIYLDADTVVNMDIQHLWQENIGKGGLAAVREADLLAHYGLYSETDEEAVDVLSRRMKHRGVNLSTYFNSGVLLLDLKELRNQGNMLLSGLELLAKYPGESEFYDQSILNYYFAESMTPLAWQYNILVNWDKAYGEGFLVQGIYHYLGNHLGYDSQDERDKLYYKYFLKTPWCTAEFFCKFFSNFIDLLKGYYTTRAFRQALLLQQISAALSRKSLVLAGTEEFKPKVIELLSNTGILMTESTIGSREGADEIQFCSLGTNQHLSINFSYDLGSHLYLLFVPDYPCLNRLLGAAGLQEGDDYLDGSLLLESDSWQDLEIRPQIIFEKA